MKVLYVTFESIISDPILSSQALPVIELLSLDFEMSFFTLEKNVGNTNLMNKDEKFVHYMNKKSGPLINQLNFLKFMIKFKKEYEVIHVRGYLPIFVSLLIKLIFKKKVIFDPRGVFADEILYSSGERPSFFRVSFAKLVKAIEPMIYSYSDKVVVVSDKFKSYLLTKKKLLNAKNKIEVIPTFSRPPSLIVRGDAHNFRYEKNWEDEILICYSGSMEKWQNFDLVLKLFSFLQSKSNKFRFCFFSKDISNMRKVVEQILNSEICYFDSLSQEELTSAISHCDYGVILRSSNLVNQVSAPIKIKDYLFSGVKLICTNNIGDTSEIITENNLGVLIDFNDICSFDYRAILNSVTKNEKMKIINIMSKKNGLDSILSKYKNVYEELRAQ